jgi:hypothetical protein
MPRYGIDGYWATFADRDKLNSWDARREYSGYWAEAIGGERIFYRLGRLPPGDRSKNYATGDWEDGVSAYFTPEPNAFSGLFLLGRPWYRGRGIQVGWGSDGEPLIIPTGRWRRFAPVQAGGGGE